jgi:hypothetical protein
MAGDNTDRPLHDQKIRPAEERLAPLWAAAPPPPSGRIRTVTEARSALKVPTSAEPGVLKAWGVPFDFRLIAFPVADDSQPDLVAEFAALLALRREGQRLTRDKADRRLRLSEKSNTLWIVHGPLVQAADKTLVIGALTIGPAFDGQLSRKGDEIALGVTSELLRLLSPTRLLSETVEYLQRSRYWSEVAQRLGAPSLPEEQQEVHRRIEEGRPRHTRVPEQQIKELAQRYLVLHLLGIRHPLPQLAREYGITRDQVRDRIHKARRLGYLQGGKQGRAGANIGPRLKALGWSPPYPHPDHKTHTT